MTSNNVKVTTTLSLKLLLILQQCRLPVARCRSAASTPRGSDNGEPRTPRSLREQLDAASSSASDNVKVDTAACGEISDKQGTVFFHLFLGFLQTFQMVDSFQMVEKTGACWQVVVRVRPVDEDEAQGNIPNCWSVICQEHCSC